MVLVSRSSLAAHGMVARCVGDPSPDGGWRRGAGLVGRVWGQFGLLELRSLRTARGRVHRYFTTEPPGKP